MDEFPKSALDKFRQWHFGWLVIIVALFMGFFLGVVEIGLSQNNGESQNNDFPQIKGQVSGMKAIFEITDSDYLNITLKSSSPIEALVSSAPKVISIVIQSSPASSTQLTLSGFVPNKTYYRYDNSFKNETAFSTGNSGTISFIQDISQSHLVWIQETRGTLFIPADCNTVGTLNPTTNTCTLNQDLSNNIEMTTNGLTLDCNGHKLSDGSAWTSFAILLNNRQNVTVKNCVIKNATNAINAAFSNNNTFVNNSTSGNGTSFRILSSDNNTILNNISTANGQGVALSSFSDGNKVVGNNISDILFGVIMGDHANSNKAEANTLTNHRSAGVLIGEIANSNVVSNNIISNNFEGILVRNSSGNTISNNEIKNNQTGAVMAFLSFGNTVFNNNFVDNTVQAQDVTSGNSFNVPLPSGGNFWDNYDTPAEGCNNLNNDNFCDAPFVFTGGLDNFPWTRRDGWAIKPIGQNAAELAKELVNSAYLYGGKGWDFHNSEFVAPNTIKSGYNFWNQASKSIDFRAGVDCSGLIIWAYNRSFDSLKSRFNNFVKAEGADEQFRKNTEPITEAQLVPGDVIFSDFDDNGFIDHVAMFVGESGGFDVVSAVNKATGIVGRLKKDLKKPEAGFVAFKRVISALSPSVLISASSPVDLIVIDPDNFTITPETIVSSELEFLRQIPGVLYYSEMEKGVDVRPIDQVYSYTAKTGDYIIRVILEAGTLPNETYTLDFSATNQTLVLAQSVSVSQIPINGYGVTISPAGTISSFTPVAIDIKPGSDPNSINLKSKGVTPVAVLTDKLFNAQNVIINSVTFAGASPKKGKFEDIDNDDDLDLVLHFNTRSLQLTPANTEAILTGKLTDDNLIKGKDSVRIVNNPVSQVGVLLAFLNGPVRFFEQIKTFLNELMLIPLHIKDFLINFFNKPKSENILQNEQVSIPMAFKTYRNKEWEFEFKYPENWTFDINSFYSPSSKFNLQGDSSAEDYNPLLPVFLLNVVTSDFADRAVVSILRSGAVESEVVINGAQGKKLEYDEQHGSYKVSNVTIILPFGSYKIILVMRKEYEDIFNQILASFKFLK